jgi:hypothetical protein
MAKRRLLGIPLSEESAGKAHEPKIVWTKARIALLGKLSDTEAARKLGLSRSTVRLKRRELRIPSNETPPVRWTASMIALLGSLPDAEVARRLGLDDDAVSRKRWKLGIAPAGKRKSATR